MRKSFSISEDFMSSLSQIEPTSGDPETTEKRPRRTKLPKGYRLDGDTLVPIEPRKQTQPAEAPEPPEGFRLVPEAKTRRLQLLITPTTKKKLEDASKRTGRSINDLCNEGITKILEDL